MLAVPPIRAAILGPKAWPYLLLARFDADKAAALGSPLAVDVGTLTVTDAGSLLSQSGGSLLFSGTFGALSGVNSPSTLARVAGRALILRVPSAPTLTAGTPRFGWAGNPVATDVNLDIGLNYASATSVRPVTTATNIDTVTIGSAPHDFAFVMRATGGFLLARAGGSGPYTLLWVYNATATAEYAKVGVGNTNNVVLRVDDVRILDLPAPWNSDYGIAAARLATTTANSTVTAPADAVIEHTITAATGVTQELHVRRQDATNKWIVRMDQGGSTIKLIELVANVETERDSKAQTWTNATQYRVVVTCEGATIKTYVANVAKNSYASATNFQAATGVLVDTAGADLVAWPRTIALPQAA